jgi:hypothetical protein
MERWEYRNNLINPERGRHIDIAESNRKKKCELSLLACVLAYLH